MNKYEKLFQSIFDETKAKKIEWKQIRKTANSDLIFNSNLVFRQFSGEFKKRENIFNLVFVEKKTDDPEYAIPYQKYIPELLIIDKDDELLVTLTDAMIDKAELIELKELLEDKSDRAKLLFD